MQVLDHACDSAIDQADQPLNLWAMIERCAPAHAATAVAGTRFKYSVHTTTARSQALVLE